MCSAQSLASLFSDIQKNDPRIDELAQNAHEFTLLDFAYPCFSPVNSGSSKLTHEGVSEVIKALIEIRREQIYREFCEHAEECSEVGQDFINLINAFEELWTSTDAETKADFVESQRVVIAKALADDQESA